MSDKRRPTSDRSSEVPKLLKHDSRGNPRASSAPARTQSPEGGAKTQSMPAVDPKGGSGSARPRTAGELARDKPASGAGSSGAGSSGTRATGTRATLGSGAATVESTPDGVRRARLKVVHVEPWTVAKITFALSIALGIVGVVAVSFVWLVLSFAGVWDQINSAVMSVLSDSSGTFDITDYLGFGRLVGFTILLSAINTVVFTAVAVIGSHLYNLAAQLLGGIDITVSEED